MKIGMLQPAYLPWIGFFEQLTRANTFVISDDVQFTSKDWRTRNRIKTANGVVWLSVPTHGTERQSIKEVRIIDDRRWQKKHLKTIEYSYRKARYFEWLMPGLESILNRKYEFLLDLDMELIYSFMEKLGLTTDIVFSSKLNLRHTDKNLKMLETMKQLGGDYLYEGKAGKEFLDTTLFSKNGITVEFQDYKHPVYPQLWGGFVLYLSVIDLLFNCGPDSLDYVCGKKGLNT